MAQPPVKCKVFGCGNPRGNPRTGLCRVHAREAWQRDDGAPFRERYGKGWEARRRAVLRRANGRCEVCRYRPATAVDHVVPRAEGGTEALANLRAVCDQCHHRLTMEHAARARRELP